MPINQQRCIQGWCRKSASSFFSSEIFLEVFGVAVMPQRSELIAWTGSMASHPFQNEKDI